MENYNISPADLAWRIDHTLLKPEATIAEVEQVCHEAFEYEFATVCVNPCYVRRVAEMLREERSKVCGVVGFPLGANRSEVKRAEAVRNIKDGANELDMVINIGAALADNFDYVRRDIEGVLEVCRQATPRVVLKVILEIAVLPSEKKVRLCELAGELGVDFIKTSTGMHPSGGATVADVRLMDKHRAGCKIKASGGIRDLKSAWAFLHAGADRIGTSSGRAILKELIKSASPD